MRKKAKEKVVNSLVIGGINGYHRGDFQTLKLFTSDRYVECIIDGDGNLVERKTMKVKKGYGLEIETENFAISDSDVCVQVYKNMVFNVFHEDLFKYEHDGSLGVTETLYTQENNNNWTTTKRVTRGVGVECITQVMTKEFIRNNYPQWKELFARFEQVRTSCVETLNCGMHVNVSNTCFGRTKNNQIDAIKKLYYIIDNAHFKLMARCFNRDLSRLGYCNRHGSYNPFVDFCWEEQILRDSNHTNCMNYSHFKEGRIEIRLVGGQSNYACFRNTMEVVFHLVERVQTISKKDCDNVVEIFKGCNKYVYSRLERCMNEGCLSREDYEKIGENVDYSVEYL